VTHSAKPPAETGSTGKAVKVAVGAATPLNPPESPQAGDTPGEPVAAAVLTDPDAQAGSGSSVLPLLVVIAVGLILGYACFRLWRLHQRRRLEALWHQRDAAWEAVVRQIEIERGLGASEPAAGRQKIDV
jgi:uncharacterized protein HemX